MSEMKEFRTFSCCYCYSNTALHDMRKENMRQSMFKCRLNLLKEKSTTTTFWRSNKYCLGFVFIFYIRLLPVHKARKYSRKVFFFCHHHRRRRRFFFFSFFVLTHISGHLRAFICLCSSGQRHQCVYDKHTICVCVCSFIIEQLS